MKKSLLIFAILTVLSIIGIAVIIATNENDEQVRKFEENSKAEFIRDNSGTETIDMPIF